jgi:RNA polymerase-binding protein DksA
MMDHAGTGNPDIDHGVRLADTVEGAGRFGNRNPDRGDLAQTYSSRERNLALQEMEEAQLQQIEAALTRLEQGTYGRCQNCGDPIPPGRLEILPYATLCVACQSHQERTHW